MVRTREMSALEDIRFRYVCNSHVRKGYLRALLWQMNVSPPLSDAEDARYIKMHVAGERYRRCAA